MYQKMFVGIKNTKDLVHGKELTDRLERGVKKQRIIPKYSMGYDRARHGFHGHR